MLVRHLRSCILTRKTFYFVARTVKCLQANWMLNFSLRWWYSECKRKLSFWESYRTGARTRKIARHFVCCLVLYNIFTYIPQDKITEFKLTKFHIPLVININQWLFAGLWQLCLDVILTSKDIQYRKYFSNAM